LDPLKTNMASPSPATPPSISEALNRLWAKFLPEMENRVSILEIAALAHAEGCLTREQGEAAHAAAHKLAGTLGTFGLHRGTELARQAEVAFAEENPGSVVELSSWVAELRMLIHRRT
jgi:HPt (histidine-containing phosphotransfer) domain-containing protein